MLLTEPMKWFYVMRTNLLLDKFQNCLCGFKKKICASLASCCSVPQSCLTLWDPMNCSTPGFPVLHYLLELAQTHVHWVNDAIQPSHPLSSPSPPALNISKHQIFPNELALHRWPKYSSLEMHTNRDFLGFLHADCHSVMSNSLWPHGL